MSRGKIAFKQADRKLAGPLRHYQSQKVPVTHVFALAVSCAAAVPLFFYVRERGERERTKAVWRVRVARGARTRQSTRPARARAYGRRGVARRAPGAPGRGGDPAG